MELVIEGRPEELATFVQELIEQVRTKTSANIYDEVIDIFLSQRNAQQAPVD